MKVNLIPAFILCLLFPCLSFAQTCTITGKVVNEQNSPVKSFQVTVINRQDSVSKSITNKYGLFSISTSRSGHQYVIISANGFEYYQDSFAVDRDAVDLGRIRLQPATHMLDEVKIVEKVLAMVQKDDTIEFNSKAFKVNPDADGADLIRKMPSIEVTDKQIKAQGENVVKVFVDGKPFFGNDPYASLKNLPADIIDKVQVYNEKSDQEQFTGFNEGNTTKTINIITKADKRRGVFGKMYGAAGSDNEKGDKYGVGTTLNKFGGDRRITVTEQSNNVNVQNFSDDNSAINGTGGGAHSVLNSVGINYNDKCGKTTDISGSYFFNKNTNILERQLRRTYMSSMDSGQIYDESNSAENNSYRHRLNMRLNVKMDSCNSLIIQPQLSISKSNVSSQESGTTREALVPVNQISNKNVSANTSYSFANNILFNHKFHTKGRTISFNLNANNNSTNALTIHSAQNIYYASSILNDTLNQQVFQLQNTWNITGNTVYTEPIGRNSLLKFEYNITYQPAQSDRDTRDFSYAANSYSLPDSRYSNSFFSKNTGHTTGASYLIHVKKTDLTFGLDYQITLIENSQVIPFKYSLDQKFQNLLPVATVHYRLSKTKNLQLSYNTNTQVPSVTQLQSTVNNSDPLHLYTGNASLRQPYRHNLAVRYNTLSENSKNNFSTSVQGAFTENYITSNSIMAVNDTTISQNILLPKGSQLTMPVNINGYNSFTGNASYGLPLSIIKCQLKWSLNAGITHIPVIINNQANYQNNKNGSLGISLNSNISENADFSISSSAGIVSNRNSLNKQVSNNYFNQSNSASFNFIFWKGIIFNSALNYQSNSGLSQGYNQNYLLWNVSIGKKVFKNHRGDIRVSIFDVLGENNNIQHVVTDTYIQDSQSNVLHRYFLFVFTYKIQEFTK